MRVVFQMVPHQHCVSEGMRGWPTRCASGRYQALVDRFTQHVRTLPFVDAVQVEADDQAVRVWVITRGHTVEDTMAIFAIQDAEDPEYHLTVLVRTREQYAALAGVHS